MGEFGGDEGWNQEGRRARRPLVPVAGALMVGIVCGAWLGADVAWGAGLATVAGALGWGVAAWQRAEGVAGRVLLGWAASAGAFLWWGESPSKELAEAVASGGTEWVWVRGRVATVPVLRPAQGRQGLVVVRFEGEVEAWEPRWGEAEWVAGRALFRVRGMPGAGLHYGSRFEALVRVRPPQGPLNPGQVNYGALLADRGIGVVAETHVDQVTVLEQDVAGWAGEQGERFRAFMRWALALGLEDNAQGAAILRGMLFGDRASFEPKQLEEFRATGTLHLFAVSGQNVGVLLGLGLLALRAAGFLTWRWGWAMVGPLGLYVLAAGAEASALRAFVMAALILTAWLADRAVDGLQILSGAAVLLLLWQPDQLFETGFQLSFAVTLALILWTGPLYRAMSGWGAADPFLARSLWSPWRERIEPVRRAALLVTAGSVAAFLGSAPLSLWYFQMVSLIGVVVNIPVVAMASAVVVLGAVSLSVAWAVPAVAAAVNQANAWVIGAMMALIGWGASVPGGALYWPAPRMAWDGAGARITVLSVGGGQAAVVESGGAAALVDSGSANEAVRTVIPFLRRLGVQRLDLWWWTQGSSDHLGGVPLVAETVRVREVIRMRPDTRSAAFRRASARMGRRATRASRGDAVVSRTGRWTVCADGEEGGSRWAADRGLVIRYRPSSEAGAVLFAGDLGSGREAELLALGDAWRAEILVIGRNARDPGLTDAWLDAVQPRWVIFQGGWGHGSEWVPEWTERLRRRGTGWTDTRNGAVEMEWQAGAGWSVRQFQGDP